MRTLCRALPLLLMLAIPGQAQAQSTDSMPSAPKDSTGALNLFLDCRAPGCDFNYLRTELTWVNYVRDRTAAQVHVIATALGTGSGGLEIKLAFIGQKQFAGVDNEVKFNTQRGSSGDELRREFTRVLKLGLVQYMLGTRFGAHLAVSYAAPPNAAPAQHEHDPWNFWVFSVGHEWRTRRPIAEQQPERQRVTLCLAHHGGVEVSRQRERQHQPEQLSARRHDHLRRRSHSYSGGSVLVRSVTDHLSFGGGFGLSASTNNNLDLALRVAPTVEFDFFKYDQYTRKRLVLSYSVGFDRYHYTDTTIYNRLRETRLDNQLSFSYATTQPWGGANAGISGSAYLSDMTENRLSVYTSMSVRVVRGLSASYSLSYSRVRDQLSLAKASASDAEILLQLRQLATSYTYGGSFSLSYTFGSLFTTWSIPASGSSPERKDPRGRCPGVLLRAVERRALPGGSPRLEVNAGLDQELAAAAGCKVDFDERHQLGIAGEVDAANQVEAEVAATAAVAEIAAE